MPAFDPNQVDHAVGGMWVRGPTGAQFLCPRAALLSMVTPDHVPTMRLIAYVSEKGGVQRVDEEGFGDFNHVFILRPIDYRYGVVEVTKPPRFMLIDFYDVRTDRQIATLEPGWTRSFDTEDGALMAGVLMRRETP
jgi:hypothetical protein